MARITLPVLLLSSFFALTSFFGCDYFSRKIAWGLPKDCAPAIDERSGYTRGYTGKTINGLVNSEQCFGGRFYGGSSTIELPEGKLPTQKDYNKILEMEAKRPVCNGLDC